MTNCSEDRLEFPALKRRKVQAEFRGGEISSDGGVLLVREVDRRVKLTEAVNRILPDPRHRGLIRHSQLSLLRQRIYGICLGYEDLNDHALVRNDAALQTAVEREEPLASQATLCRLENRATRAAAVQVHEVIVEQFIGSFATPPEELILDFDATNDPTHGQQEGRFISFACCWPASPMC